MSSGAASSSTTITTSSEAASSSSSAFTVPADFPAAASLPPTHLRLKLKRRVRKVRFTEDTVDNEDLCRKKSKCCCIFHRQRSFDSDGLGDDGSNHGSDCEEGAAKRQRSVGGDADADAEG